MVDFINSKKNREGDLGEIEFEKQHEEKKKEVKRYQNERDVDIKKYRGTAGITLSKINWGLFYVEQRQNLIIIRNAFFIFFSVMVWGGYAFVFGQYLVEGARADSNLMKDLVSPNLLSHDKFVEIGAHPIAIGQPQHIKAKNQYDFFVVIENQNENFYAEFDYSFTNNGEIIDTRKGFILPDKSKYLVLLGQELVETVGDINFVIEKINWTRIDRHKYIDFPKYLKSRLDIAIKDKEFLDSKSSGLAEKNKLGIVSFKVVNNTSFNYLDLDLVIISKYGSKIVDVSKYRTGEFFSYEIKDIDILMSRNVPYINLIEVYPEKFIFDELGYVDFEVNKGIMKR